MFFGPRELWLGVTRIFHSFFASEHHNSVTLKSQLNNVVVSDRTEPMVRFVLRDRDVKVMTNTRVPIVRHKNKPKLKTSFRENPTRTTYRVLKEGLETNRTCTETLQRTKRTHHINPKTTIIVTKEMTRVSSYTTGYHQ